MVDAPLMGGLPASEASQPMFAIEVSSWMVCVIVVALSPSCDIGVFVVELCGSVDTVVVVPCRFVGDIIVEQCVSVVVDVSVSCGSVDSVSVGLPGIKGLTALSSQRLDRLSGPAMNSIVKLNPDIHCFQ